jgi:hypothetical protein
METVMLIGFKNFITEYFTFKSLQEGRNPAFEGDSEIQKLDKDIKSGKHSEEDLISRTEQAYKKISPMVDRAHSSLVSTVKSVAGKKSGIIFKHGTKPLNSVIDKAVKRKRGLGNLGDLARGAVITKNPKETESFVNSLKRKHGDKIVDHEVKEKGSDPNYGYYGSHHIQMVHNGVETELQVMHKKLWDKKKMAHKIYTSSRSRPEGPTKQEKTTSKQIFAKANVANTEPPIKSNRRDFEKLNLQQSFNVDNGALLKMFIEDYDFFDMEDFKNFEEIIT